jgi:glycosyltransferase involved in cell wall biosynthesis
MEILCLDQFCTLGGGQQCFLDSVPAFAANGWGVRALIPDGGPFGQRLGALGCGVETFTNLSLSNKHKPFWELPRYASRLGSVIGALTRQIRAKKPDVLYVNGPRFLPAAAWVARREGIPLVFHAHNRLLQRPALAVSGLALAASKALVISCCAYASMPLTHYVSPARMRVVYNGAANLRRAGHVRSRFIQNIGVVGRVAPEKGQLQFVRAANVVAHMRPAARFFVIGGSPNTNDHSYYDAVRRESRGLPLSLEGWKDDPASIMNRLDLLVVPSQIHDAAPRVILEAFSAEVPVVAYRSGGIPELIEDDSTGFLVQERTPAALAMRIADVLRMSDGAVDQVVARAKKAWNERFHIDRYRESVCEAVRSSVNSSLKRAVI